MPRLLLLCGSYAVAMVGIFAAIGWPWLFVIGPALIAIPVLVMAVLMRFTRVYRGPSDVEQKVIRAQVIRLGEERLAGEREAIAGKVIRGASIRPGRTRD